MEVTSKQARAEADLQDRIAIRGLFTRLAYRQMTASEAGVRLLFTLRRCTGLWAEGARGMSATTLGGEGGLSARLAPDLLPFPVPRFKTLSENDIEAAFTPANEDS